MVTAQCHTSDLCEYWTQGIENKIMIIFNSKSGVTTKEGDDVKVEDFVVTVRMVCHNNKDIYPRISFQETSFEDDVDLSASFELI